MLTCQTQVSNKGVYIKTTVVWNCLTFSAMLFVPFSIYLLRALLYFIFLVSQCPCVKPTFTVYFRSNVIVFLTSVCVRIIVYITLKRQINTYKMSCFVWTLIVFCDFSSNSASLLNKRQSLWTIYSNQTEDL